MLCAVFTMNTIMYTHSFMVTKSICAVGQHEFLLQHDIVCTCTIRVLCTCTIRVLCTCTVRVQSQPPIHTLVQCMYSKVCTKSEVQLTLLHEYKCYHVFLCFIFIISLLYVYVYMCIYVWGIMYIMEY